MMMDMEQIDEKERACRVVISQILGVGTVTFEKWKQEFGGELVRLWRADSGEVKRRLGKKAVELLFMQKKKVADPLEFFRKM
jgi:hypothetical protein